MTTTVAIIPATADELRGALGPESSGSFSVNGIERSLSCCSTRIFATEALQVSAHASVKGEVDALGKDEQIFQILRIHIESIDQYMLAHMRRATYPNASGSSMTGSTAAFAFSLSTSAFRFPLASCLLCLSVLRGKGERLSTASFIPGPFWTGTLAIRSNSKIRPFVVIRTMR